MAPVKAKQTQQSSLHSFFIKTGTGGAKTTNNDAGDVKSRTNTSIVCKDHAKENESHNTHAVKSLKIATSDNCAATDATSVKRKSSEEKCVKLTKQQIDLSRRKRRIIDDSDSEDEKLDSPIRQVVLKAVDAEPAVTEKSSDDVAVNDESESVARTDDMQDVASDVREPSTITAVKSVKIASELVENKDSVELSEPVRETLPINPELKSPEKSKMSPSKKVFGREIASTSKAATSFFLPMVKSASIPSKTIRDSVLSKSDKNEPCLVQPTNAGAPNGQTTVLLENHPVSSILEAGGKDQFKSNADILESIPPNWETAIPYSVLCQAFSKIEVVSSRLAIQEIMTSLFRQVMLKNPSEMNSVLYLASNSVAAAYECVELGIGDAILIKAIGEATGTNPSMVKQKYEVDGDLGTVAQTFKSKQRTLGGFFTSTNTTKSAKKNYLTATEVLTTFRTIANTKGNQSQKFKVDSIKKLLVNASNPEETKYIIRGLQGKLRIGLAQSTVLISLAHALALTIPPTIVSANAKNDPKEIEKYPDEAKQYIDKSQTVEKRLEAAVAIIKKAYSEVPSYDAVLEAALEVPLERLHKECTLKPGIPVAPMLAKPTKSVQEVLKRLNGLKFTVEYKYDGERAQIHMLANGTTKVFSRNLLDTSEKYPEVPIFVKEACRNVKSFVLDAEVVAFNNKTGQLVPFQVLSTRKKTEESAETAKVQVIVQAFDLMYLNGESLLSHTLEERRSLMRNHFQPIDGKFQFAKSLDHEENGDTAIIEEFLESAVKGQCEGLMVKTLEVNAIYEPSRRSLNWLKLKKDYLEGLGDSVDLVPLGAYHGRGKRTGVYGAYLLACYDPDTEEFQSVCKIGTGFSDEDLISLSDSLNKHKIPIKSSQYNVSDQLECDVWFDAVQVWEIKAADLSKSSAHRGALGKTGENGRGIGLRFPRFERIRDDKKPDDATTSDQILDMYYQQDAIGASNGGDDDIDDDGI